VLNDLHECRRIQIKKLFNLILGFGDNKKIQLEQQLHHTQLIFQKASLKDFFNNKKLKIKKIEMIIT
jgi:hypothetical protein